MKKFLIVLLVILIIIGLIGAGGYFAYQNYKKQDPFELEWVRIYFDYMRENHENLKVNQNGLKYYRENEKIEFCEVDSIKNPVMLYNYTELGVSFTNIFYIADDNSVKLLKPSKKDFNAECLYNIEEQKYEYYINESYYDKEDYIKISEGIKVNEEQENEKIENNENIISFGLDEKISVTTLSGEVLEIYKFDNKFIKTSVVEDNWKDVNFDNYEDAIKKDFSNAVKKMSKMLDDKVNNEVSKKEEAIQEKKQAMIRAVEEIEEFERQEEERRIREEEEARRKAEEEAKKAEEEAKKKAEEEAKRAEEERKLQEEANNNAQTQQGTVQNGNYTLKYGTYKGIDYWTQGDPLSKYETTIVLKENGTYTQRNSSTATQDAVQTYSGKFTISNVQGVGLFITFSANDGAYKITGNNEFTSEITGAVIKYQGN